MKRTKVTDLPQSELFGPADDGLGHALLNAIQFSNNTRRGGGASMNANTTRVLEIGSSDSVLVGGERDTQGKRIPTNYIKGGAEGSVRAEDLDIDPYTVLSEARRVQNATGGSPTAIVGSWINSDEPHRGIQVDAVTEVKDRSKVHPLLEERNEYAGFDLKDGTEIKNKNYKPNEPQR